MRWGRYQHKGKWEWMKGRQRREQINMTEILQTQEELKMIIRSYYRGPATLYGLLDWES